MRSPYLYNRDVNNAGDAVIHSHPVSFFLCRTAPVNAFSDDSDDDEILMGKRVGIGEDECG